MKLHPKAFGLMCAIIWGGAILVMMIISCFTNFWSIEYDGYAGQYIKSIESLYSGYNISFTRAIIGTL